MTNEKIRLALFQHGVYQYELADLLNVSEITLSRRLRRELPEDEQDRIVQIIEQHSRGDRHAES